MKLTKESTYEDVSEFMKVIDEMTYDPSGTFYMFFSHNNVEYELYGTPNFLNNGEINFQCYINDQDTDVIKNDKFSFEELSKDDYLKALNDVISEIKSKNLVKMNEDAYREFLISSIRDWGIDSAKEFCSNEMSPCSFQELQNDEIISKFKEHLKDESIDEINSCHYNALFKSKPFRIYDDFYGELEDMDLLKELE